MYIKNTKLVTDADTYNIEKHGSTIWYVSKSGNDDNDGQTPETAFLTVGKATTAHVANDKIHISPGTYAEDVVLANASTVLECELGVIFDGTGTCLTVSGGYCKIYGDLTITPAADQLGVVVSTGHNNIFRHVHIRGNASAGGWDIDTDNNELYWCGANGIKAGGKAFDFGGHNTKAYHCNTLGTTTSYGFYVNGTALLKGLLKDCTSAGHETSGYYLDEISGMTVLNCVSGAGDGPAKDVDSANTWNGYSFKDEIHKEIVFTDATQAFDLFTITNSVEVEFINAHVTAALNAEIGNCLLRVHGTDGPTNANLTIAASMNSLPIGSFVGKTADASVALTVASSAAPAVIENANYKDPKVSSIIVGDNTGTTTIQLYSDDAAGAKDGTIHVHCKFKPVGDGWLAPA